MAKKITVPGELVDAVKLRMYNDKCSYAEAAKKVLKEAGIDVDEGDEDDDGI